MSVVRRYRINRSWGDGRWEAFRHVVRGRSFSDFYDPSDDDNDLMTVEETTKFLLGLDKTLTRQGFPDNEQIL